MTQFGATAMSVSAMITSITSAINTFKSESSTGFEKFGAAIAIVTSALSTFNAIQALSTTLSKADKIAKLGAAASSFVAATAGKALGLAKTTETGAVVANTAAWYANPIMWIAVVIVGVIAVLSVLIGLVVKLTEAIKANSAEGKLEAAKARAEELNAALEDAKTSAENLKSAFDSYDSVVQQLEECTKGTKEWQAALQGVNNEVLGLMADYPELASMVNEKGESAITYGEDGELVVQDWAREELTNQANQAVENTQMAAIRGNQDVREAQIVVDTKELSSALNKESDTSATKHVYDAQGKLMSSTDASAQVAKYIADNAKELSGMTPEDQKAMLETYLKDNNISANVDGWTEAITALGPDIAGLASSIDANTKATQIENETIAKSILADEENVQNSKYTDEITSMTGANVDKVTDAKEQEMIDAGWGTDGISKATGVNDEAEKIFNEYAAAAGIKNAELLDTTGTDSNRKFVYDAGDGEKEVSLEVMRQVVAASKANEELANNASRLVTTLSDKTEEEAAAITAAVTGDTGNMTVSQAEGTFDIEAQAKELSKEDLEAMGYSGDIEQMRADYIAAYNEVAANASTALADIVDDYVEGVQNSLNSLKDSGALDNLTLDQVDSLGKTLEQAFAIGGSEGVKVVQDVFQKASDSGMGDELLNAFSTIDWNSVTPDQLSDALADADVAIDYTDAELEQLIATMRQSAVDTEGAVAKYKTLNDIIKDISTGDTISQEDYDALGDGMEDYFLRMADGTYKLTADADEFYKMVHE